MLRELGAVAGAILAPAPEDLVALNTEALRLDRAPAWDAVGNPVAFAADLDAIRDAEFEDGLRDRRLRFEPAPAAREAGPRVLQLDPVIAARPDEALPAQILLSEAATQACEWLPARLVLTPDLARPRGRGTACACARWCSAAAMARWARPSSSPTSPRATGSRPGG